MNSILKLFIERIKKIKFFLKIKLSSKEYVIKSFLILIYDILEKYLISFE
jgi:hypothetical protein